MNSGEGVKMMGSSVIESGKKIVSIKGVDAVVWRQFRGICLERGVSIGEAINELLEMYEHEYRQYSLKR